MKTRVPNLLIILLDFISLILAKDDLKSSVNSCFFEYSSNLRKISLDYILKQKGNVLSKIRSVDEFDTEFSISTIRESIGTVKI